LLIRLYSDEHALSKDWSLFRLKQRFTEALMQDQLHRVEQKWLGKWRKIKQAA
jgi:hypothetical protein